MRRAFGAGRRTRARLDQLNPEDRRRPSQEDWYARPEVLGFAGAGAATIALALGPPILIAVGLATPIAAFGWQRHARAQGLRRRQAQLPEALERIATALRSGASLPQALQATGAATSGPLGLELTALAREAEHGSAVVEVLDRWIGTHDDRGTRLAATALALAAGIGAAPARAIDGVAATLRERRELAAERRALATQARTSALVLSVAPVVFALLLGITDSAAARFLLSTPAGWTCLVAGLSLDAVGAVWMARLVRTED